MADSAVDITVGSGTSIDTRTEASNGNHRQVVVIGDPSVNAGVAPVDGTLGIATYFATRPTVSVVGGIAAGSTLTAYQGGGAWLTTLATLPVVTNISGYALEAGNLATIVTSLSDIKAKTDNLDVTLGSRLASGGTLPITGQVSSLAAGGSLAAFQGGTWTAQPGNTPNTTAWLTTQATLPVVANINNSSLPVTQSGTWTVQPGNTPNTTAWLVTMATIPVVANVNVAGQATVTAIQGDSGTSAWLATLATLPVVTNVTGYALEAGNLATIVTTLNNIKAKTDNLDVTLGSRLGSGATLPITGTINSLAAGGSLTSYQGGSWTVQPGNTPNTTAWLVTLATLSVIGSFSAAGQATVTAIQGDPGTKAWLATLATLPVMAAQAGNWSMLAAGGSLAAAQLGTWTVQPGNTPNTVGWLTTLATLPVVANINNTTLAVTQSGTWDEVGINDSGNSITVDGTVTANLAAGTNNIGDVDAIQSGTWTVQPGNTPNTTAWLTTQATLPVVIGTPPVTQSGVWNVFSSLASGTSVISGARYMPTLASLPSMDFAYLKHDLFSNLMVNTNVPLPNSTRFNRFLTFASMASIMAAPGAGRRLVVREMDFSGNATLSVKLVEDHAGTPVTVWGPHYFLPYAGFIKPTCYVPITANKSLGVDITGTSFNSTLDIRIETENA